MVPPIRAVFVRDARAAGNRVKRSDIRGGWYDAESPRNQGEPIASVAGEARWRSFTMLGA